MRVKCASSARESCAGIRASFTNDAYASNARKVRVNLVPESTRHLQMTHTRQMRVISVRVRVVYLRPFHVFVI